MVRRSLSLLAVVLLAAVSLAAQMEDGAIGYLAEFRVKPGKDAEFMELVKQFDQPVFEKLMAEGAVGAWGVETMIVHREKGTTHIFWWSCPNYAGMDKVFAAFAEQEKKTKAEEEAAAADARKRGRPVPKTAEERFLEAVDVEKHHDHLTRSIAFNHTQKPLAAGTLPYTWYSFVKVEPGKGSDWFKLFEKYTKPIFEQLLADGTLLAYGVDVEEIHTEEPQWRLVWTATADMAAMDNIRAAFRKARESRSAEERETIGRQFDETTDSSAHRDFLTRAVIFQVAMPPAGQ